MRRTELRRGDSELRRTPMKRGASELGRAASPREGKPQRRRAVIRALRPSEPLPDGEPKRYANGDGYVRLRWLVGTQTYVEEYEHRVLAGRPPPWMDVHHRNRVRDDNRPENLQVLTPEEHRQLHEDEDRTADPERGHRFGGHRSAQAQAKATRRLDREEQMKRRGRQMAEMYAAGKSTTEIGEELGLHPSNVSRHLRAAGALMRPKAEANAALAASRPVVHRRSGMRCERCGSDLKWAGGEVHHRATRGMGGTSAAWMNEPQNLAHLCRECHRFVTDNPTAARREGWVRWRSDRIAVPCLVATGSPGRVPPGERYDAMAMLLEDGTKVVDTLPPVPERASGPDWPMWTAT